jgi:hypothetical protein
MNHPDLPQMLLERFLQRFWQHRNAIFCAFAVSDCDFVAAEIDILDPQPQAFHQPQASAPARDWSDWRLLF